MNIDFQKIINTRIRVKLDDGRILKFNPFRECLTLPSQYNVEWFQPQDKKWKFKFEISDEIRNLVKTHGIETDNIEDLNKCFFDTSNLILNLNFEE